MVGWGCGAMAATDARGTATLPAGLEKTSRSPEYQYSRTTTSRPFMNRIVVSATAGRADPRTTMIEASPDIEASSADRALADAVIAFIAASSATEFDRLALAIHRYQYRRNAPYHRFVDRGGRSTPRSWRDIPAVPADAFRESTLACGPAVRVYESSGTTRGPARRARHHVTELAVYEAAALAGFHRAVLPPATRRRFIVAAPERDAYPASSLGEMVSWIRHEHDAGGPPSFLTPAGLDGSGLARALDRIDGSEPILLLGVTAALLRLLDAVAGRRWRLPVGSLVVDTGGCKGHDEELARAEILRRYREGFGIDDDQIVNEYGMTELGSQLYARGSRPFQAPPWLRVLVCDPLTSAECSPGDVGVLRYLDLVNVGSVVAIQTEDLGRVVEGGIELLGRVPHAEARGCSLLASV